MIRVLQHVDFEDAGTVRDWARETRRPILVTRLCDGETLPDLDDFEWLVVMGGPMSVHDEDSHEWLSPEKRLIRRAVESGKTVVGICLGAQLIADALGARVYPGREKEIGWFPVDLAPGACRRTAFAGLPSRFTAFHWHGETFDLPRGAARLAGSTAYENQAFAIGSRVLGIQFHLESAERNVRLMVDRCAHEIGEGSFVQTASENLAAPPEEFGRLRRLMFQVLDTLAGDGRPARTS
jgi:GMP synthase-like glutamine amidotransferase